MVNRLERGFLPAIETLTELDLGDGARTEVSNVSGIGTVVVTSATVNIVTTVVHIGVVARADNTIAAIRVVSRGVDTTTTVGTEGGSVWLGSKHDSGRFSGVEEQIRIVGWILSLNETIELTVRRSLLAKDGIPEPRRIRSEVRRGVLLSLAVLHGCGDHLGLSISVELAGSVCRAE